MVICRGKSRIWRLEVNILTLTFSKNGQFSPKPKICLSLNSYSRAFFEFRSTLKLFLESLECIDNGNIVF